MKTNHADTSLRDSIANMGSSGKQEDTLDNKDKK